MINRKIQITAHCVLTKWECTAVRTSETLGKLASSVQTNYQECPIQNWKRWKLLILIKTTDLLMKHIILKILVKSHTSIYKTWMGYKDTNEGRGGKDGVIQGSNSVSSVWVFLRTRAWSHTTSLSLDYTLTDNIPEIRRLSMWQVQVTWAARNYVSPQNTTVLAGPVSTHTEQPFLVKCVFSLDVSSNTCCIYRLIFLPRHSENPKAHMYV